MVFWLIWLDMVNRIQSHITPRKVGNMLLLLPGCRFYQLLKTKINLVFWLWASVNQINIERVYCNSCKGKRESVILSGKGFEIIVVDHWRSLLTCKTFLCFGAYVFLLYIVYRFLFFFGACGEFYRFLHRGWARNFKFYLFGAVRII